MFGVDGQHAELFMDLRDSRYLIGLPKLIETILSCTGQREEIKTVAALLPLLHVPQTHLRLATCNRTAIAATDKGRSALDRHCARSTYIFRAWLSISYKKLIMGYHLLNTSSILPQYFITRYERYVVWHFDFLT